MSSSFEAACPRAHEQMLVEDEDSGAESTYDFASGLQRASSVESEAPRPAKRRRLSPTRRAHDDHESDGQSLKSFISDGDDNDNYSDDLPSHHDTASHRRNANTSHDEEANSADEEEDDDKLPASKRKIYEPKHRTIHEPVFVTQLTQPPSSPSRIRGPRWQKPPPDLVQPNSSPPPPVPPSVVPQSGKLVPDNNEGRDGIGSSHTDYDDGYDDDMKAAIAASLESFQEEDINGIRDYDPSKSQDLFPPPDPPLSLPATTTVDTSFLDDIPEDAFDTSPDSSPQKMPANPMPPPPQHATGNSQQTMRQTTLMGTLAQKPKPQSSQSGSHNWPLASQSQAEPPTHHRLDPEALDCWVYPANLGERRDYQFNIAHRGLFHNLLVALPTGLGKTFIAATIMLNWYRWTTEAQIVFVAPTKPLVSQQVEACFGIVGIPRSRTTMLTGDAPPAVRQEEWQSKRVFFMTPQTLINDLKSGIADPKKIVLLVIDEAHRATGSYAYTQVVQFLQRFNTSFRVLALTATPGSTVESVQEVIDNLNISRVEIRTETSLDIRQYVHSRDVEIQTFDNSEEMAMVMQLFAKALQPVVDELRNLNAYWARDPMTLTPYGLTVARKQWMGSSAAKNASWALKGKVNAIFTVLASLAHSIELLKYHGIGPFFRSLLSFQDPSSGSSNGKSARQIRDDANFKKMMDRLRVWTNKDEFVGHPKLDYLKQVVLNHFLDAQDGKDERRTRIMIFAHFRDSAEEIVRVLKRHNPIVKPHVFVGQANAKGSEGMDQKTQLQIVEKFKAGVYNTIVATSIGEEGLDIGEVDLIVCYDSSASPIRMLQRMGRTGRKRQGNIVLLLMKGKEEDNYTKAKDNYEKMQDMIASGARFHYHTDKSPRIIPREIQPFAEEKQIEIPVENSQTDLPEPTRRPGRKTKRPPKKFHMPDGVETGFTTASKIGQPKKKKSTSLHSDTNSELDVASSDDHAPIPHPHEISITSSQNADLASEIRAHGNSGPPGPLRIDAFPSAQRRLGPTRFVRHGRSTRGMVTALRQMAEMGSDCEETCRNDLRADDVEQFMSSDDELTKPRPRPGSERGANANSEPGKNQTHDEDDDDVISLDGADSFSSLISSPRKSRRRRKRDQSSNDEDSDIPDPATLFDRLLSANKKQLSPPQEKDEDEPIDDGRGSTPRPSAPRRNRYVISGDSDSF